MIESCRELDGIRKEHAVASFEARDDFFYYYYLVYEAIGTAATPGLLCQPRVIVKMIVEKLVE
jgi:hypothetical protein